MAKVTDEIVVGANGTVRVAPAGTAEPADISAAYGAGWVDLGYIDAAGVKFNDDKKITDILVWQLFYPARKIVDSRDFTLVFNLSQFSALQVEFAFGGGAVTTDAAGKFRYRPPAPDVIDNRKLAVDWIDGDDNYRLIIPNGMVSGNVSGEIVRTKEIVLPITFSVIGQDSVDPFYILTDDETWTLAS
jgi:hypothetical protein